MQSVPITTEVVSSKLAQGEIYSIQLCQCFIPGLCPWKWEYDCEFMIQNVHYSGE
jgi:hypothetical protein